MFRASFIILLATVIQNICNYVYHFTMGRYLSVENYGVLGTLASTLMIFSKKSTSTH